VRFVESPLFTKRVTALLRDEEYLALQLALVFRPEQGPIIAGSSGLRKVRWAAEGRGKRGGLRVIYYWEPPQDVCLMLYAYAKSAQGDLTALDPTVRDDFKPMLELGLVDSITDVNGGIFNYFRDDEGLNVHRSYGYLANPRVGEVIANWWKEGA